MATNKNLKISRKRELSTEEILKGIIAGDRYILAHGLTLLESTRTEHRAQSDKIIQNVLPKTGKSYRIGITGVPGVGKSTFIESFGNKWVDQGHKVAVLAIDPSSSLSKGSILGDKTRMEELSRNPSVFIRPSASTGSLGGVARNTQESILLCEAAGFDIIIVETVGVGQSETTVSSMVDVFMLLMLSGAGDELQGIKRGIMEMAQLIVINKADGDNEKKALQAKRLLQSALHYFPIPESNYLPQVRTCSALEGNGIVEVVEELQKFFDKTTQNGYLSLNRKRQNAHWFQHEIEQRILSRFFSERQKKLKGELLEKVSSGELSPFEASSKFMSELGI